LKHIDLFTGIGGFSLACHWNNIETVVMCEKDKRCRQFLDRTWPGIPVIEDIKEFDGTRWTGAFILTAGVPCQPASRAGKQGGKGDDRWLWPEAIRIVDEAKPRWCLFENPPGIYDVGINGILSDLESIGYETGIVEVPACAVNSPQIRQRVWIVAHHSEQRLEGADREKLQKQRSAKSSQGDVADTKKAAGVGLQDGKESETPSPDGRCYTGQWGNYDWTPCADGKLRRTPDDSFDLVDGLHRSVLAALGNSIVPQVAYEIIKAIVKTGKNQQRGG